MNAFIEWFIDHARTVYMLLVLLFVAGISAFLAIPKESNPDVVIPIMLISVTQPGISPEDSERLLLPPLEKRLKTVEGLKKITGTAGEGFAHLTLEFNAGFDAQKAKRDVKDQVDLAKKDLPADAKDPTVNDVNVSLFPVVAVSLYGDVPERTLLAVAKRLQAEIERLPQVLSADIVGDRDEELDIIADPALLQSYAISPAALLATVTNNNRVVAAGALQDQTGRFPVTVPGLIHTAEDLFGLPVKVNGDTVVTLGQVAEVQRVYKDRTSFARFNGQPAVTINVVKALGENIIQTVDGTRFIVEAAQKSELWPAGVKVELIQDQSQQIKDMLGDLQNDVMTSVVLVMIVIIAALGVRSAGLVGIAIPGAFLMAILSLQGLDLTLNFVVLFSLILTAGRVVDGAIVVTEFADRKLAEGLDRKRAYAVASTRMAWPIITSYGATLLAFLPLLFWPGIVGEFMKFLPITTIATLLGSLVMALVFIPSLGSKFGASGAVSREELRALAAVETGDIEETRGMSKAYVHLMRGILKFPGTVIIASVLLLVGVMWSYGKFGAGVEFFPNVEPETAAIQVHARGNISIDEKDRLVRDVEALVLKSDGLKSVSTAVGGGGGGGNPLLGSSTADTIGTITVEFAKWNTRRKAQAILDDILAQAKTISGIRVDFAQQSFGPPTGKPISVNVQAVDSSQIAPAVQVIVAKLNSMAGVQNVQDTRPIPGIEWQIDVNRTQAGIFGADVTTVGNMVKLVTSGVKVSSYRPADTDDELDILVRYPRELRTVDQLDQIQIQTAKGSVPASNFIERRAVPQTGTITRIDERRTLSVNADVLPGVLAADKITELKAWLATTQMPGAAEVIFQGQDADQLEAQAFLGKAFTIALFLIAITMLIQFNSFYQVFIILSSIILSTIGVMLGLLIAHQPFGIVMSGIGVISLAGVVVDNNILLINTYNYMRERYEPMEAIIRTGAQRLRPVVLTAGVTVLGLLPTVFGMHVDLLHREVTFGAPATALWQQLSLAVASGLTFGTILTLVVTPSLLAIGANTSARMAKFSAWRARRRGTTTETIETAPAE